MFFTGDSITDDTVIEKEIERDYRCELIHRCVCFFAFEEVKNECNVKTKKQTKNQKVSQQSYIDIYNKGKNKNIQNAFKCFAGNLFAFVTIRTKKSYFLKTTFESVFKSRWFLKTNRKMKGNINVTFERKPRPTAWIIIIRS